MGQKSHKQLKKGERTYRQHRVLRTCGVAWRVGRSWHVAHRRRVCNGILSQKDRGRRFTSRQTALSHACNKLRDGLQDSRDPFADIRTAQQHTERVKVISMNRTAAVSRQDVKSRC